jgi:GMP synthase-like glutamine amidotransferase
VKPALILQHGPTAPPGLLAEWASGRGLPIDVHHTYLDGEAPELDGQAFLCCLGSKHSPLDREVPVVAETLALVARAVEVGVPVLGLCYGGQVLADVMGATVEAAPVPEFAWHSIDSDAPALVPQGPWLEWHYQRFTLPPGARELARSAAGVQAFSSGPHLGVQFHPESTIEIVKAWARSDHDRLVQLGITDAEAQLDAGEDGAELARSHAFQLFDGFWERAQRAERRDP